MRETLLFQRRFSTNTTHVLLHFTAVVAHSLARKGGLIAWRLCHVGESSVQFEFAIVVLI